MKIYKLKCSSLFRLIIIGSLILLSKPAFSAETKYDLYDLIELGLKQSIPHQTGILQNKNVYSSLLSSYLDFLPSATVSTSRHYSDIDSKSAGFVLSKTVSLNEPTYFNWRRANIDWLNAQLDHQENRKTTAFEIFSLYIRVLENQKRMKIQEKNLQIQEKIYQQIELLYNQQQRALIDLKSSEIALINAQISLENADIQYQQARENLFLYLNVEDLGYSFQEPAIEITEDDFQYTKPIDLLQSENNLKRSSISLLQTRLDFLPSLSLSYSYNYRYTGDVDDDRLFDLDLYDDSYTISLTASYSLFNFIEHRQVYHRNKRNLRIQKMNYDYLTNTKEKRFEQLTREWENEKRIYDLAERRYEIAEETLQMAQERFNLGLLSLLELDQATGDYLQAEIDLSSRYYQLLIKQEEINLFLARKILDRW